MTDTNLEDLLAALGSDDPVTRARARFDATEIPRQVRQFIWSEMDRPELNPGVHALSAVTQTLIWEIGLSAGVQMRADRVEDVVRTFVAGAEQTFRLGFAQGTQAYEAVRDEIASEGVTPPAPPN